MKSLIRVIAICAIAIASLTVQGKAYYTGKGYVELQGGINAEFDRMTFYEQQCALPACAGVIHVKELATKTVTSIRADEIKALRISTYPNFHLTLDSGREGEFAFITAEEKRQWPPRMFMFFVDSERTRVKPDRIKAIVIEE